MLETVQTQKNPKEELRPTSEQSRYILEKIYQELLKRKKDFNEGGLKAISEYPVRGNQSFYAAWVDSSFGHDFDRKKLRTLRDSDSYLILTTDRRAMEDFIKRAYGLKHPFK